MSDDINAPAAEPADLEPLADDEDLLGSDDDAEKEAPASEEPSEETAGDTVEAEPSSQPEPALAVDQRHPNPAQGGRPL